MATTVTTWTISTLNANADYSTITAAQTAMLLLTTNLVTSDAIYRWRLLDSSSASGTSLTGFTCDDTHYLEIYGSHPNSYPGAFGSQQANTTGIVSGAAVVVYISDTGGYGGASNAWLVSGSGAKAYFNRCVFSGSSAVASNGGGVKTTGASCVVDINWCFFYDCGLQSGAGQVMAGGGTVTVRNCTGIGGANGLIRSAGTAVAINCYMAGHTTADYSGTWTLTTCMSSDTTANSVGGAGNGQVTLAQSGIRARRHPNLVYYWYPYSTRVATAAVDSYQPGYDVPGKRDVNSPAVMLGGRQITITSETAPSTAGGNGTDSFALTGAIPTCPVPYFSGTTGYRRHPGAAGVHANVPIGTGDRAIWAQLWIDATATNALAGVVWMNDEADRNDMLGVYVDASGYFVGIVSSSLAVECTATSTTKIGDLSAGAFHEVQAVLSGTTLTIYVDGVAEGTGDASALLAYTATPVTGFDRGHWNPLATHYFLGANVAITMLAAFNAAVVVPMKPNGVGGLATHEDLIGWNRDVRLTERSSATLLSGGTAWGAATVLDILSEPVGPVYPIGCCGTSRLWPQSPM